ncbi:DUF4184 family protein [Longimicrobium sp.]|uniref:DUF4184 family protein n=1 Tax=Longimicrobium sp. TaxID=2029185 RepID=UPI002D04DCC3|nr:DUF4184 family protein [Longimicrobium sp.]HSU13555.1 DUF4184 family protein [Longimicrobium sp.]
MPITPAHAAAAWPLHRAWPRLPLAALVIGTFSPDLEYILHLAPRGKFGHSPAGFVVFCLPVTLLVWWAWRALVRPALTPLLPPGLRRAAEAPPPGRRSDVLPLAIFAALLGAATHVLWDGFTHEAGWAVAFFPALMAQAFGGLQWYSVFQFASTLVGGVMVMIWIARELRRFPREERRFGPGQRARLVRFVAFVSAVTLAGAAANAPFAPTLAMQLGRAFVGAMLGFGIALVAYALFRRWRGETSEDVVA